MYDQLDPGGADGTGPDSFVVTYKFFETEPYQ